MTQSLRDMVKRLWELNALREPLVTARNRIVDKPFFLWRFWLRKHLALIDAKLDTIDKERLKLRVCVCTFKKDRKKRKDTLWNSSL